jgi:hypothetical protein
MADAVTPAQWKEYDEQGYVVLGKLLNDGDLHALQQRIDEIMLGKARIDYDKILMQLDSKTGAYDDAGEQSRGFKGATLEYRKIQDLENDPLFLEFMQRPIFRDICKRIYGDIDIACFRAMFMNKPAHKGTYLPWHQDRWTFLNKDPLITVWTALDPATVANGCVQVVPGSHKVGLINPEHTSGFLTKQQGIDYCPPSKVKYLELKAGEVALLHNHLLHSSDVNKSDIARRAFSVCYMGTDVYTLKGETYPVIFGKGALTVEQIKAQQPVAAV